jgi:hypothetical protein
VSYRYAVRRLDELPVVPPDEDWEPLWHPLQHFFELTAFGANVYVARADGDQLLGEHDESGSYQEELYVVLRGEATFTLDGETFDVPELGVVSVPEPSVRRVAYAKSARTAVLALGGEQRQSFRSSWRAEHFRSVPRVSDAAG